MDGPSAMQPKMADGATLIRPTLATLAALALPSPWWVNFKKSTEGKDETDMKKNWVITLSVLCVIFFPENSTARVLSSDRPYIYDTGDYLVLNHEIFSPLLLSGNGRVILGVTHMGLSFWTDFGGISAISNEPSGLHVFPKSLSYNGHELAGIFTKGQVHLTDYGLFRWSYQNGFEVLKPSLTPTPIINIEGPINISNDGDRITFFCSYGLKAKASCASSSPDDMAPWIQIIWTKGKGMVVTRNDLDNRFDYAELSGDFNSYLVGNLKIHKFGRIDDEGRYASLQNFPSNFDPSSDRLIMNRNASLIAEQSSSGPMPLLWRRDGKMIDEIKMLPGCEGFFVTDIDDSGGVFGLSFCPALSAPDDEPITLRWSSSGMQTIGNWLGSNGVPNNLGPNVVVKLVSDNGKTVYGEANIPASTPNSISSEMIGNNSSYQVDSADNDGRNAQSLFLAHVK